MAELPKHSAPFNFYLVLACLELTTDCFFEESNQPLLSLVVGKTAIKELTRDTNQVRRLMRNLVLRQPSSDTFRNSAIKFYEWQRKVVANQLENEFFGTPQQIKYLTLGQQHLLDCYYHLCCRFAAEEGGDPFKCRWCKDQLVVPWSQILNDIFFKKLPNAFIYLNLGQATNLNNPNRIIESSFDLYYDLLKALINELVNGKKRVEVAPAQLNQILVDIL